MHNSLLATNRYICTARKSTGGTVGPYTLAGHQAEDEDEDLGETGDEEEEDEVRPAVTA